MTDVFVVVGLGNPGPTYAGNRHNVGFMVLDLLAQRANAKFRLHKGRADVIETRIGPVRAILAKPRSFMNTSGGPVSAVLSFFSVPPAQLVVVHDELDLPYGSLRLKHGGGDNGHNGLKSISQAIGTREYGRVRFGIGRPPGRQAPADYVLRDFGSVERKELELNVDRAADAAEALITRGLEAAQNAFH